MGYFLHCLLALGMSGAPLRALPGPPAGRLLPAPPVPARQRQRVNDTLELVLSQPYCHYSTEAGTPATLWQRAELRGRRGYHRRLNDIPCFYASVGIASSARAGVLRVLVGRWSDVQPPCAGVGPLTPLADRNFTYLTWDVRYGTVSHLVTQELERERPDEEWGFVGGLNPNLRVSYHLLPYWLAREQARVARTHRLPPAPQLAGYLALSQATGYGGLLKRPYRPLLARLLRAYAACPQPAATARQVAQARRALARAR